MTAQTASDRDVRGIFSAVARRYDLVNAVASFGLDRGWRRFAAAKCDLPAGGRVLDVCAGTGDLAIEVSRLAKPREILAVDFCDDMMALGREKVRGTSHEQVISFRQADATDLPYPDGSFDAVTVAFGIRNLSDMTRGLTEVCRVLKVGGCFVCLEFSTPVFRPLRVAYRFYLRWLVPLIGRVLAGNREGYRYLASSIINFPDQEHLRHTMLDCGFSRVDYFNLTGGIVAVHVARR